MSAFIVPQPGDRVRYVGPADRPELVGGLHCVERYLCGAVRLVGVCTPVLIQDLVLVRRAEGVLQ